MADLEELSCIRQCQRLSSYVKLRRHAHISVEFVETVFSISAIIHS